MANDDTLRPATTVTFMNAPRMWRRIAWWAVFIIAYVAVFRLTNFLAEPEFFVSPWNPEAGLSVAAGVAFGWPGMVLTFLARVASLYFTKTYFSLNVDIPSALLHALCFSAPAAMLRQMRLLPGTQLLKSATALLVLALAGSLATAMLQVALKTYVTGFALAWVLPATITLTVGDFIGIVTVAPLLVLPNMVRQVADLIIGRPAASLLWCAAICGVSLLVFGFETTDDLNIYYLVFIPVFALAMSSGIAAALLAILVSDASMMAIIYTRAFSVTTATELQFFMATMAVSGLFLGGLISERRRMAQELIASHAQLHASQNALMQASRHTLVSEMAAALSHELSQPLMSARNYVSAIERLMARPRRDIKQIAAMLRAARDQIDVASDLIRETRSFLGRGDAPYTIVRLDAIVDLSLRLLDAELRQAGIAADVVKPDGDLEVVANRTQIQQVILNLLRNSIDSLAHASRNDRRIAIEIARKDDRHLSLVVRDNGPGLPDELLPHLFMPFQSNKPNGLGLGLSLCRSIVTHHGGEIELADNGPDGAAFAFSLRRPVAGPRR